MPNAKSERRATLQQPTQAKANNQAATKVVPSVRVPDKLMKGQTEDEL